MKRAKASSKVRSKSKTKGKGKARANAKAKTMAKAKKSRETDTPRVAPGAGRAGMVAALAAVMPAAGIDLVAAGEIVQAAIPGGPHDIDSTLEANGLITAPQRTIFRQSVVDGVEARGFTIAGDDVPNGGATTLRTARTAVRDNARPR
jgi:hypothetical protein